MQALPATETGTGKPPQPGVAGGRRWGAGRETGGGKARTRPLLAKAWEAPWVLELQILPCLGGFREAGTVPWD